VATTQRGGSSLWANPTTPPSSPRPSLSSRSSSKIRLWSRNSFILPFFVGLSFDVYDGKKFVPLRITSDMVGFKFGAFCFTKRSQNKFSR
jgi:small subunit ribosomal protein S19